MGSQHAAVRIAALPFVAVKWLFVVAGVVVWLVVVPLVELVRGGVEWLLPSRIPAPRTVVSTPPELIAANGWETSADEEPRRQDLRASAKP